jgi:23S rRNA (uridine2552-2'-O)-methyltransferase
MYNRKDHYYKKAKAEGRASRASYKLEQIQAKFRVIKKGDRVFDLGCAPGSWMEVVSEMVGEKGFVAGIDILPIKIPIKKNMAYVQGDINDDAVVATVVPTIPFLSVGTTKFDVIISDMAPNTSGVSFKDSYLSYELDVQALEVAKKYLKEGGNFVAKIFQGEEVDVFRKELRTAFKKVETYIPDATRQGSKELYLIGLGFISQQHNKL